MGELLLTLIANGRQGREEQIDEGDRTRSVAIFVAMSEDQCSRSGEDYPEDNC